jgi:anti-anti-sigma factor
MPDFQSSPEQVADHDASNAAVLQYALSRCGRSAVWVRLGGELDLDGAAGLERCLARALGSARLVVVDLRELTFIDSAGVHLIVEARERALRTNRRLVLVRGRAQTTRLFTLAGLNGRLEIVDLSPLGARGQAAPRSHENEQASAPITTPPGRRISH